MKQSKLDSKLTMAGSQKKKLRAQKGTGNKPTIDCAAAEKHHADWRAHC